MAELCAESFSPWSEKARWALDHHHVPHRYREYVPVLGEPGLRLRLKQPLGRVTVPVLFHDGGALRDSLAIAEHAERIGSGAPLLPSDLYAQVLSWNERSERALAANRVRVVARIRQVSGAKAEALPAEIPGGLRPLLAGSTALALAFLRWKYELGTDGQLHHKADMQGKEAHQKFRMEMLARYGVVLTAEHENGLRYAEGELSDYTN